MHLTECGAGVSANHRAYLAQQSQAERGTGVLDHIALHTTGLPEVLARLQAQAVPFQSRRVDAQGLFQLFLFDPNGVKVELNIDGSEAEAAGVTPQLMASDLPR